MSGCITTCRNCSRPAPCRCSEPMPENIGASRSPMADNGDKTLRHDSPAASLVREQLDRESETDDAL